MPNKLMLITFGFIFTCFEATAFTDSLRQNTMNTLKRCFGEASVIGAGIGGQTFGLGFGFIKKRNNWGGQLFAFANWYRSPNKPANYQPSSNFIYSNSRYPKDNAYTIAATIIREFPTEDKKVRLALATGLCYTHFSIKSFEPQEYIVGWFDNSSNYKTIYSSTNAPGLVFKASAAYMPRSKFGFQMSLLAYTNRLHTHVGLQFQLIWGKLWDKPKRAIWPKKKNIILPVQPQLQKIIKTMAPRQYAEPLKPIPSLSAGTD